MTGEEHGLTRALQEFHAVASPNMVACITADLNQDFAALHKLMNTRAAECAAYVLSNAGQQTSREFAVLQRMASQPFAGYFALTVSHRLEAQGNLGAAIEYLRSALTRELTPRQRSMLSTHLLDVMRAARHPGTQAYQSALEAAIKRSPYPAGPYWYAIDRAVPLTGSDRIKEFFAVARQAREHGAFSSCGNALIALVNALIDVGDMKRAKQVSSSAIECATRSDNAELKTRSHLLLGRALVKGGEVRAGIAELRSAERLAMINGYLYNVADVHHNLAHAYETLGDRENAKVEVAKFVNAARELINSPLRIVSLRDAGVIHWDSGDRASARRYFSEMVGRVDQEGHDQYWAGEFYERIGDLATARRYYQAGLQMRGDSARKTAALTRIYLALGSLDSAAVAASLHDRLPQTPEEVPLMPIIKAARGEFAEALEQARRWADLQRARGNIVGSINAQLQIAELAQNSGDEPLTRSAARAALGLARADSAIDAQARAYALLGEFKPALELARRSDNPGVLADVWASYAARVADPRAALDSALVARKRTADRFEYSFDRVRYRNPVAHLIELNATRAIDGQRAELLYQWSVRRKAERPPATSLTAIRAQLPRQTVLIDYTVTDSTVGALVVAREGAWTVRLPTKRAEIRRLVDDLRRPTKARLGAIDLARAHFNYGAARGAYDVLLRPLRAFIAGKNDLRISADDALHFIPFDALLNGSNYVIEDAAVAYLPSPDAAVTSTSVSLARTVFIAGDAPGVAQEAGALQQLVPAARVTKPASFEQLRAAATGATVLHLASHAYADAANPLSAFFQLGSTRVAINEIEQLRLNAPLVVLTACETTYGKLYAGGPFGLATAFGAAGANAVVATLWPVGANSAEFTRGFYTALRNGASPTSALREAKLRLKSESDNPLLWAPFVINSGVGAGAGAGRGN